MPATAVALVVLSRTVSVRAVNPARVTTTERLEASSFTEYVELENCSSEDASWMETVVLAGTPTVVPVEGFESTS